MFEAFRVATSIPVPPPDSETTALKTTEEVRALKSTSWMGGKNGSNVQL
jgi:hypothetical protein